MPAAVKPSERNAGKRWSTLDKRDLADALARGDSLTDRAAPTRRRCPNSEPFVLI
jgi:hypothetical protein